MTTIQDIANDLKNGDAALRAKAAKALADVGDAGGDVFPHLDVLINALSDVELVVRKEVVWAVYTCALQGKNIEKAIPALKKAIADPQTRGNALIGYALHLLNKGKSAEVEKMLKEDDRFSQFAAAYAITDHAFVKQDATLFKKMLGNLRPGLQDTVLQEGVAGSVIAFINRKKDTNFLANALLDVMDEQADDLKKAPLQGIMMKVQQALSQR